jgi:hypothetical protein
MADSTEQSEKPTSAVVGFAQTRPLILFFLLAYAWAWTFWLIVPRVVRPITLGSNFDDFDFV